MPRKDRTFSDSDVIRIIGKYLTRREQQGVLRALGAEIETPGELPDIRTTPEGKKVSLDVERVFRVLTLVKDLVTAASLIPGPQRAALAAIALSLTAVESGVKVLDSDIKLLR